MTPADVQLAMFLIKQIREGLATLKQLKADSPEVYAQISQHHKTALEEARAELGEG